MPHWNDLTEWLRAQLAVMAMHQFSFLTFNIHVHPDLEALWVSEKRDVRVMIRDRLRKELNACLRKGLEHFFVVEGWSKLSKSETRLHFHGGALIDQPADITRIEIAAARAAGHHIGGRTATHRAVHVKPFSKEGPRYINYLFKSVRRKDDRLDARRVAMSRSLVQGTREFWEMITERV